MSDAAANHRFGRRSPVFWDAEGRRPLDRWGRSAEEVRHHVAFVSGLVQELRGFAGRCQQVLLGREAGARFWARFDASIASLERVIERDAWYAAPLEEAERQQLKLEAEQ
jgi:hypothetical protein